MTTYFRMSMNDAYNAKMELYRREVEANKPQLTKFSESSVGGDISIWTTDPAGEVLFRQVLGELGIQYLEGDEQQVKTGWEKDMK